jgi:outer membrane cobalamin receptor
MLPRESSFSSDSSLSPFPWAFLSLAPSGAFGLFGVLAVLLRWLLALAIVLGAAAHARPAAAEDADVPAPSAAPALNVEDFAAAAEAAAVEAAEDSAEDPGEVIAVEGERPAAAPGATTVRRAEITRIPGSRGDALTGVKNLPGVANNGSLTPGSGGLVIRGSSPEDSRILVDGFEIPILYHFLGVQSVLPSEMLDDVEYLPGAYGPAYGRASAGIVSVTSRRGARELGGFVELSFINAAGLVEGPLGKRGSFSLAARRSVIDAILPAVIPSDANLSFTAYPRYYDYQAQAEYQLTDRWQLTGFLFGSSDRVELLNDNDNPADPVATGRFANEGSFTRAIAAARYRAGGLGVVLAASAYTDTNHFSVGAERFLLLDRDGVAARAEATWSPLAKLQVTAGAEADLTRIAYDLQFTRPPREGDPMPPNFSEDALLVARGDTVNPDLGGWLNTQLWPVRNVQLDLGARVDAFVRNSDVLIQPRAQATWNVVDGSTLRAAAGRYSRPPEDLDENLQDDLLAERATHVTLGAEQRLLPGLTATATAFHNSLDELVVLDGSRRDMASLGGYINAGTGRAYGLELMLRLRRDDFFGWISYTGAHATRRDSSGADDRLFDYDQAHNLIAVASWQLSPKWQLGGRFQLTTGKPYTPVTSSIYQADRDSYLPVFGEVNSRRVDTQHQLDLRVDRVWQFRTWKLSGYLDIANTYLNAAVVDYSYNYDYSSRQKITTLPILPSIGLRGEM